MSENHYDSIAIAIRNIIATVFIIMVFLNITRRSFSLYTFLLADVNGMPAWTPSLSSELLPRYSIAVMRSNRWPGAYAFAKDK